MTQPRKILPINYCGIQHTQSMHTEMWDDTMLTPSISKSQQTGRKLLVYRGKMTIRYTEIWCHSPIIPFKIRKASLKHP